LELSAQIADYLSQPSVLWDTSLTQLLVVQKLQDLSLPDTNAYTLTGCIDNDAQEVNYLLQETGEIRLVEPSSSLETFYQKHGLEILNLKNHEEVASKVTNAITILELIEPVGVFIRQIVKSIQILKAGDEEIDVSYSHPDIPFSIFFSVCQPTTIISDLRVAESILHEAMHLKLTLIENFCPLVEIGSKETYYSPWRDEQRPIRGVLHGLFVFRAIADFYFQLNHLPFDQEIRQFLIDRISSINNEIGTLSDFGKTPGLTIRGKKLVGKLLS
jgi:HEXXH motif-containing protein